ncbi:MAG: transposase [Psychromonas sp.]|nr:transposase [Psychromonas sp.]
MALNYTILAPFSPNLNPIERLWKVMNEYARDHKYFTMAKSFGEAFMSF